MNDDIPTIDDADYIVQSIVAAARCRYCGGFTNETTTTRGVELCMCPGGPFWNRLIHTPLGQSLKLAENLNRATPGYVVYYDVTRHALIRVRAQYFRDGVIAYHEKGGPL